MSITIKSKTDLMKMREAGKIAGRALQLAGQSVQPGMTTLEVDKIVHDYIVGCGAYPSFLGYGGFPGSACVSVNDEVIHGIPSKRKLQAGDIVSIDVGAYYNGFHGDTCGTFAVGKIKPNAQTLLDVTQESLMKGIEKAVVGARLSEISAAVEQHCVAHGYGVVRDFCGHGIGRELHEEPEVPNYFTPGRGNLRLQAGMVICIEPMINEKGHQVKQMRDGLKIKTRSGSLSAHFEHAVAITLDGPVVMTDPS